VVDQNNDSTLEKKWVVLVEFAWVVTEKQQNEKVELKRDIVAKSFV